MSNTNQVRNESYLIRMWRDNRHNPWRVSLQKIRTGQLTYFAGAEEMWAYLQAEMADEDHQPEMTDQHRAQ